MLKLAVKKDKYSRGVARNYFFLWTVFCIVTATNDTIKVYERTLCVEISLEKLKKGKFTCMKNYKRCTCSRIVVEVA